MELIGVQLDPQSVRLRRREHCAGFLHAERFFFAEHVQRFRQPLAGHLRNQLGANTRHVFGAALCRRNMNQQRGPQLELGLQLAHRPQHPQFGVKVEAIATFDFDGRRTGSPQRG